MSALQDITPRIPTPGAPRPTRTDRCAARPAGQVPVADADTMDEARRRGAAARPTTPPTRAECFSRLLASKALRTEFTEFLSNVLMQVDPPAFAALLRDVAAATQPGDYESFYRTLLARIGETKEGTLGNLRTKLRSLGVLKKTLAGQVTELTGRGIHVDGYLELGYPGRLIRPLRGQGNMTLTGHTAVVTEGERLTDLVESGVPRPYKQFIALDNYAPLDKALPADSLDMIVCPIGLHHAPPDKLAPFIASIHRVLRPGGSFIVREHDVPARSSDMHVMANLAHSVFNAANGVSWEEERDEVRNFQSLQQWTELLDGQGFTAVGQPRTTVGDPTRNALMRFTKRGGAGEEPAQLERSMRLSNAKYVRPASQTYLTTMEWHLVHTAREQADFAADHAPQSFPWLKHIGTLWRTFFASMREAHRADGLSKLPTEYTLMNLFMVLCTTGELLGRGLMLAPLHMIGDAAAKSSGAAKQLARTQDEYARFIEHTPFFNFPYGQHIGRMWRAVGSSGWIRTPVDVWIALAATVEFAAKAAVSAPLAWFYKDDDFSTIHLAVRDPHGAAKQVVGGAALRGVAGDCKAYEVERYLPFRQTVQRLLDSGVEILSVGGQKRMQLKVKAPAGTAPTQGPGCKILGEIPIHTNSGARYLRLDVDVAELGPVLRDLSERGIELTYIHDF